MKLQKIVLLFKVCLTFKTVEILDFISALVHNIANKHGMMCQWDSQTQLYILGPIPYHFFKPYHHQFNKNHVSPL